MLELKKPNWESVRNDRRVAAERLLEEIRWEDETTGYCRCPGISQHTGGDGAKDCRITLDGVPTVYCVHQSCQKEIEAANKALRSGTLDHGPVVLTPAQKRKRAVAVAKSRAEEALKLKTEKSLPGILKQYRWPYLEIIKESPNQLAADDQLGMFKSFLEMYDDDDIIWIGNVIDTGKPEHDHHFQSKARWIAGGLPAGPFTCPASFVPGTVSRSKDNVASQRYLVVESDFLKKDDVGAIFRWLDRAVELPLCAVVDTAGKSLHGWFDYPPPPILEELKIMLPAMGCDPKMFGSSQPCRLPGGMRDGRIQRLIYAAKGGAR